MFQSIINRFKDLFTNNSVACYSLKGRKDRQEDSYYCSPETQNGRLVIVADGVGGHGHGDFASQLCIKHFKNNFENTQKIEDAEAFLRQNAMSVASLVLQKGEEEADYKNCGTTLTGFLIRGNFFYTINIGDSRVYIYNVKRQLLRLTNDHSIVQQLIDQNKLTEEEARAHHQKNIMTSAIGQPLDKIKIDVEGPLKIEDDEYLIACSDGVHDALTDNQIKDIVAMENSIKTMVKNMAYKAFIAGSHDNITVCAYKHT